MDDSPQPVRDFYHEFKMNYPVALGGAKTGDLYGGVLGLPIAFVIDREGIIRWSYLSPDEVNPGADGILEALESMTRPEVAGTRSQS